MQRAVIIISGLFILSACASEPPASSVPASERVKAKVNEDGDFELRLKGTKGETSRTYYHSDSAVEDLEEGQKVRDHEEIMDFAVDSEVLAAAAEAIAVRMTTIEKDGTGSLHDYAFPEPDESIDFFYTSDAHVLKADPFPKESIFYLPPVSLPAKPVKIGDTWTLNHSWISNNDGLPLNLNMVTIFKGVTACGRYGLCADLEVSGKVDIDADKFEEMASFNSRLWGRILFSFEKGDVIWSEVRSKEVFKTSSSEMRVLACMVSKMQASANDRLSCKPSEVAVPQPTATF